MEFNPIETGEKRSIIVVGKTGAGKSKFLNDLIEKRIFTPSANVQSCTEEVESSGWERVTCRIEMNEASFELKAFDTPGIADSKGRSKQFLNKIAQTIQTEHLNVIIILVEYGRFDTGSFNNLEVLRECLNDLSESSCMIIINKVPTERLLDRKRKQGEKCVDRQEELKTTFKRISDALGIEFRFNFFLEDDLDEDAANRNSVKYNLIRKTLLRYTTSRLNASKVKTWDKIFEFYTTAIKTENEKLNELKIDFNDKLDKVEFDIACNKYLFLDRPPNNSRIARFFYENYSANYSQIKCKMTRDEFYAKSNQINVNGFGEYFQNLISDIVMVTSNNSLNYDSDTFWKYFFESFEVRLKSLDTLRNEMSDKTQSSIVELTKILEEKKEKLNRLESALANPYQNNEHN